MKQKKLIIAILGCLFFTTNAIAVTGIIYNRSAVDYGFLYITVKVYVTNPSDAQYVKVNDANLPGNELDFNLYMNPPANYFIDTANLASPVVINTYDFNCHATCEWQYLPGKNAPKQTAGGSYCAIYSTDLYAYAACPNV